MVLRLPLSLPTLTQLPLIGSKQNISKYIMQQNYYNKLPYSVKTARIVNRDPKAFACVRDGMLSQATGRHQTIETR